MSHVTHVCCLKCVLFAFKKILTKISSLTLSHVPMGKRKKEKEKEKNEKYKKKNVR